jgi:hypothetical protein
MLRRWRKGLHQQRGLRRRLKRVLDVIGRWHNWILLTELARETLGKSSTLAAVLRKSGVVPGSRRLTGLRP